MAFIKYSEMSSTENNTKPDSSISQMIFKNIRDFIETIKYNKDLLGELRVKAVITYITNIYFVEIPNEKFDVLGRGVDFSFRLEAFADSSHFVINKMFKDSLPDNINEASLDENNRLKFQIIECRKKIKGWKNDFEIFYIITCKEWIEDTMSKFNPSFYTKDVSMELFTHYIKNYNINLDEIPPQNEIDNLTRSGK